MVVGPVLRPPDFGRGAVGHAVEVEARDIVPLEAVGSRAAARGGDRVLGDDVVADPAVVDAGAGVGRDGDVQRPAAPASTAACEITAARVEVDGDRGGGRLVLRIGDRDHEGGDVVVGSVLRPPDLRQRHVGDAVEVVARDERPLIAVRRDAAGHMGQRIVGDHVIADARVVGAGAGVRRDGHSHHGRRLRGDRRRARCGHRRAGHVSPAP